MRRTLRNLFSEFLLVFKGGNRPWLKVGVKSVGGRELPTHYALELACIQKNLTNPSLLAVGIK
jgi:hypothetical protein